MVENLLSRGLNTIAEFVSKGRLGVEINPDFKEWEDNARQEGVPLSIYDIGTLIVIDDEGERIIPKYKFTKRD